ncbi:succinate dehydrogenase cytochrome b subunit [Desulfurispirillum indicum]|uniref:Succinate dehydrogenase (Or fumarate reductase) cytochrome b subunit, b558 family n=1 Tax=Desulfurispirillum indicum (strain ATCC BAA-1389 / DSM 22839 / S5) TaxID=653733 RepID=E6W398_DESIS|nr:succinate dehydrogenase cytochrome b subunit [Desulfurispirillum indicum]ADU66852.1 succinate dehydrogenase (or fumarate reductase) cytochrome b subunit, b558 family [Desulfurispirillum indicum S5]UCZ56171.1 succinate dehydrogenase cytochrome b subunit [Desulfurispirillum indicum]
MQFIQSAVGRKIIMAVTGLCLVLFLFIHALGNLGVFSGPDGINAYADFLHSLGAGVWLFRIALGAIFVIHIAFAIQLTMENMAARPDNYTYKKDLRATFASKTMIYTGFVILAFAVYHLLHFTIRVTNPEIYGFDSLGRFDVFTMVVKGFSSVVVSLIYLIAMIALVLHTSHGIGSMFQSVGLNNDKALPVIQKVGKAVAIVLFIALISTPVAILIGIVSL